MIQFITIGRNLAIATNSATLAETDMHILSEDAFSADKNSTQTKQRQFYLGMNLFMMA